MKRQTRSDLRGCPLMVLCHDAKTIPIYFGETVTSYCGGNDRFTDVCKKCGAYCAGVKMNMRLSLLKTRRQS